MEEKIDEYIHNTTKGIFKVLLTAYRNIETNTLLPDFDHAIGAARDEVLRGAIVQHRLYAVRVRRDLGRRSLLRGIIQLDMAVGTGRGNHGAVRVNRQPIECLLTQLHTVQLLHLADIPHPQEALGVARSDGISLRNGVNPCMMANKTTRSTLTDTCTWLMAVVWP